MICVLSAVVDGIELDCQVSTPKLNLMTYLFRAGCSASERPRRQRRHSDDTCNIELVYFHKISCMLIWRSWTASAWNCIAPPRCSITRLGCARVVQNIIDRAVSQFVSYQGMRRSPETSVLDSPELSEYHTLNRLRACLDGGSCCA